jgi:hypothetical protein
VACLLDSTSYFNFILNIAKHLILIFILNDFDENGKAMLLMLHYDIWQSAGGFDSLEKSIIQIGKNKTLVNEIIEVVRNFN